ncbi:MAG: DnaD domain protein [Candidatus Phytoplasma stylosanthis]|nr:DnaD domain protein [Candidatus Phytoplasma stylosanthis]MDV3174270.1 DnaD domain protein [Candidatus Phytoplasma stylosanthis]
MFSLYRFKIQSDDFFSNQEQKILNLLYQPLIGKGPFSLYNAFYFLSQSKQNKNDDFFYNHQFLFDLLNIDEIFFLQYKDKLEAVNLLSTFQNLKKETIYFLKKPLNYNDFFEEPILSQFLLSEVGENMYIQLQNLFFYKENIELENYEDVSKKFSDIFKFKKMNISKNLFNSSKNKFNNRFSFFYKYFNYELFIHKLSQRFKKPFLLEYKNIEYITKLGFIYEIKPEKMAFLYQTVFRNDNESNIDLSKLKIHLRRQILKENKQITSVKIEDVHSEENEMIFYLKNSHPNRIINNFIKNVYICSELYNVAFQLIKQTNVDIGIINALFMYIFNKKNIDDKFPTSYNYFKTVLDSWLKKGIISTETAYDFLIEDKKINKNNNLNTKNPPKWLDNIRKNLGFES